MLPVAVTINALPCALGLQHCPANVGGQDTSYRAPAISHSCCVNQARLENGLKKNMPLINTSHATSCTDTQMDQFHCTWVSARGFLHVGFPVGLPYPWFFTVFMAFAKVDNNVVCQWIRGTALHTCMQTLMNVFSRCDQSSQQMK